MGTYATRPGSRFPPGATARDGGGNFCAFGRHSTRVELLLFEPDAAEPFQVVVLAPETNRSSHFWHVFVEDLPLGSGYARRMDGPNDAEQTGRRFLCRDLVDPWARAVSDALWTAAALPIPATRACGVAGHRHRPAGARAALGAART